MKDHVTGEVKSNFIAELPSSYTWPWYNVPQPSTLCFCNFLVGVLVFFSFFFSFPLTSRVLRLLFFFLLFFLLRVFILHALTICSPKCSYSVEENKHDFGHIFILF